MKLPFQIISIYFLANLFVLSGCKSKQQTWQLNSPDNTICITIYNQEVSELNTALSYKVDRKEAGKLISVIETSPLGLIRKDQQFAQNLLFVSKSDIRTIDEAYKMSIGHNTQCRNFANEVELEFKNENGSAIQIVFRAYNDGIAFKYVFSEKSDTEHTVTNELTGFKIPQNGKAWIAKYDVPSRSGPSYEKYYENGTAIGTASPNREGWAFPALFNSNKNWLLISEANLLPNYCGIRMEQNAPGGLYKVRFPESKDAEGVGAVEPNSVLPWSMPWRAIIIGSSLATIYESQMINNLSDAVIPGDFSWVKPGRASWSWLSDNDSPKNYNSLKAFVDLSEQMKWEYSLVDANWDIMKGGDIEQLVKYSNSKGVGILLWYNSGGPHNIVSERPRDIICDAEKRVAEFKKLQKWGVKGIKIDFWHSDKQNLIKLYHDVLKDAAECELMVDFHGCTIPRGWSRTYPNLVSMESVRGEEFYLFDSTYTAEAPVQNTILPYTRNVIGTMDYTPVGLTNFTFPHLTSYAHELALTLVFDSGILHFADNVKTYSSLPPYVADFLKTVPVVFDESHFIEGEPGKLTVIASRKGSDWYIAGISSDKQNVNLSLDLPFIKEGKYTANIINDGIDSKTFANEIQDFKSGKKLDIKLIPYGGFIVKLTN